MATDKNAKNSADPEVENGNPGTNEPTPEQLGTVNTDNATPTKAVPADEVNTGDVEHKKAKAVIDPQSPTVQAQTGPEVVAPIQPEEPLASEVAAALNFGSTEKVVKGDPGRKTTHTISDADIERHPELKEQGVKDGDEVEHGSLWIHQYPTADRSNIVQEKWPRDVSGGRQ